MDRISAVFILGIISLVMISSYIVYDTWMAEDDMAYEVLIFNDDTSVTNNTDSILWLRAKVADEEVSSTIPVQINENSWIDGEDGWYYYIESLEAKRNTVPFARAEKSLLPDAKHADVGSFKLKVEAVEQGMLPRIPENGREAFFLLKREKQGAERILL